MIHDLSLLFLQATIEQEEFVSGFDQVLNDVRIKNEANANNNTNNNNNQNSSNNISTNNSTAVTITSTNTMSGGGIVTYAGESPKKFYI